MAYTLQRSDVNGGVALDIGIVQKDSGSVKSDIQIFPLPLSPPEDLQAIDILGAEEDFSVECIKKDTPANLRTFWLTLRTFVNGDQYEVTVYHNDFENQNINVKILDISRDYDAGIPEILTFTIRMVRASTVI